MNLFLVIFIILVSSQIRNVELKIINKFCESQKEVCRNKKHIACLPIKENNPNIRLMMEVQLNLTSKTKIVQHFNTLKDNFARGYSGDSYRPWGNRIISNMRGLSWNNELSIIALKSFLNGYSNNNSSFCYTYVTDVTSQIYNLFEISSSMLFQNKINDKTFPELLKGLTKQFNINILHDVTTNLFGCAGGVYVENNHQIKIKLKCMFSRIDTNFSLIKIGSTCGDCDDWGEICNQQYNGLCGQTRIPVKTNDVRYISDSVALPQTNDSSQGFFERIPIYINNVKSKTTYYLIAYSLFLAIISSILACIWKCRKNPVFCLCKTAICCATKKMSKSEDRTS